MPKWTLKIAFIQYKFFGEVMDYVRAIAWLMRRTHEEDHVRNEIERIHQAYFRELEGIGHYYSKRGYDVKFELNYEWARIKP